jgi:hypothetical protein
MEFRVNFPVDSNPSVRGLSLARADMKNYLKSHDIDQGLLDSILIDGHAFARAELNNQTVDSIIIGAERGLRKQVMENLSYDEFLV